jgi:hypothetical protein
MGYTAEVEDQPDLTIPEDTIVPARLDEIKIHEFTWTDYKDKDNPGKPMQKTSQVFNWWFEVTGGEYKGRRVKGQTDLRLSNHPRNKFRMWAEALLGRDLPVGMKIDTDDLVGLACELSIKHKADKKDASKKYEEIDEVMPLDGGAGWSQEPPF